MLGSKPGASEPSIVKQLDALGLIVPAYEPLDSRVPIKRWVRQGNLLYLSGHGPQIAGLPDLRGVVGKDVSIDLAREAARRVALNLLSTITTAVGRLENVSRVVRVFGMVNSNPDFTDQSEVLNAASEIFIAAWGPDRGRHARSAVGVAQLPGGIPVEIEMLVSVAQRRLGAN